MENKDNIFKRIKNKYRENKAAFLGIIIVTLTFTCVAVCMVLDIYSCNRLSNMQKEQSSLLELILEESDKKETVNEKKTEKETEKETVKEKETSSKEDNESTTTESESISKSESNTENTGKASDNERKNTTAGTIEKLHVEGTKLVNESGQTVVLNGVSTHGIAWFPQYINKEAFKTIRDSFGGNVIRIAMYSDPSAGYYEGLSDKVEEAVSYATELGMYVIIDWHILSDGNPNTYKSQAIKFFDKMSGLYKDYNNVLYEICNEPNGNITWENDVKPYAIDLIKTIRKNDSDGIILVGSTTWCQDLDIVADSPITGYSNIMYTLHFYAATHQDWNRQKVEYALNKGLPIFVSEFNICDASGNGANDINSANKWMELMDRYNISFVGWNLSNKAETCALISSSCGKTSGWTDDELTESGRWIVEQLRHH